MMLPPTPSCNRRSARSKARPLSSGFSMVELIVVVSMLGILTAMIVPVYAGSLSRIQFENTQADLVSVIRYVQERAVSDALEYRIFFDPGENGYWVGYAVKDVSGETVVAPMTEDLGQWQYFPPYIRIEGMKARRDRDTGHRFLACFPNGACDRIEINFQDTRSIDRRFRLRTLGVIGELEVKSDAFGQ